MTKQGDQEWKRALALKEGLTQQIGIKGGKGSLLGGGGVIHGLEWYIRDRPCMEEEEYM